VKIYNTCKVCAKTIENKEKATIIVSGSLGPNQIDEMTEPVVFHDSCFLEVAGEAYHPRSLESNSEGMIE